ncbi:MAG: hypothetical protein B7Z20_12120, partial [Sphingobium sp. 32-64-5]
KGGGSQDRGFVSIPELALRQQRNRLLVDGAYASPTGTADLDALAAITSFFTVPSMGVHPDDARSHLNEAEAIFAWLADYRPQEFPGKIDREAASRGLAIYAKRCAVCHGTLEWNDGRPRLMDFPDWVGDVGTDTLRSEAFSPALADAVRKSSYARLISVRIGEGYAAPPLAGLWASAPYLHNGSVQSLAALINPRERMSRFMVGGHALDWNKMGLRVNADGSYPVGYKQFSTPQWVDTRQPGLGNRGHEFGSDLSSADRRALLEFLKLL